MSNTPHNSTLDETLTHASSDAALYQSIVEDSAIGVFVADVEDRRCLYFNAAFCAICGFDKSAVAGRRLDEILALYNKKAILTSVQVAELSYSSYSEFHVTRRGLYLAIKAKALIWNGTPSYIMYIADETREHARKLQLEKLINEVPAGIGIFDIVDGHICLSYINDAYYALLGTRRESRIQYMGVRVLNVIHKDDLPAVDALARRLLNGEDTGSMLLRVLNGAGSYMWFSLSASVTERGEGTMRVYGSFTDCGELVHANEEMKRTRIKEQTLMDSIPGGTAIYRIKKNGQVSAEYVSEGYCRMVGYTSSQILANPDISGYIYAEDTATVHDGFVKALTDKTPICLFYHVIANGGTPIFTKLDAKIMDTEPLAEDDLAVLYAVHTKVSTQSQKAMQEQKYYRMVLDMTGTAYCEWDKEYGFYASEAYCNYAISGGGFDALMGRGDAIQCIHSDDRPLLMYYMKEIVNNTDGKSITIRMLMKDGRYQWTQVVSYAETDADGGFTRLVGVLRDVNKEWEERSKRLQAALDEAQKANRAKTAFLSRVSHDMRTPLNGILGLTSFLRDSVTDTQALNDISQLEMSGQYLLNLINDTLDVSRIENGRLELHPTVCDGRQILENISCLVKPNIAAKHLTFNVKADEIPATVTYMDVARVEQVMMNILGNAVKFTPEGGSIDLTVKLISETDEAVTYGIDISDTGIGMDKEFLPHIFDAFSQADDTQTNSRQGTGLGMAITKQLVELMDGSINVESELGKGSTFKLVLPFKKATPQQIEEWHAQQKADADVTVLKDKCVLLCEDHPLNAQIATRLLQQKGMRVERAANGSIGVEMFKATPQNHYDAVLMDIRMPVLDGLDATRQIRALTREDAHTVPIIAMTGNSFDEDVRRALDAGMNAHLSKPIDAPKLFETLAEQMTTKHYFRRKRVLVVDDVALNRAVVAAAISADYDLAEAENGKQALEILHSDKAIDAVITDIMMPVMDGIELIKQIRADKTLDNVAIIANTQYGEMTQEAKLAALGANEFIYKPNTPETVSQRLRSALHALSACEGQ